MAKIRKLGRITQPLIVDDPYIITIHHVDDYPAGNDELGPVTQEGRGKDGEGVEMAPGRWHMYYGDKVPGFPVHPHRGFETVTIVRQGTVDHHDSGGNKGRYQAGDVQWMTAGSGMQHSEMFPLLDKEGPNTCELFQVWLNLPPEKKFVTPAYKMLWREDIPKIDRDGVKIDIVAGELEGLRAPAPAPNSWAADPENKVRILVMALEKGATFTLPAVNDTLFRGLYFYAGEEILLNDEKLGNRQYVFLDAEDEVKITNTGDSLAKIFVLEGEPIGAPVVAGGPYVMNTREEIYQAYADYQKTQFGGWPFDTVEPVMPGDVGRTSSGDIK